MKTHSWMVAVAAVIVVCLAGCTTAGILVIKNLPTSMTAEADTTVTQDAAEAMTLFDTSTVKIVLEGTETTVTDKTTGTEYGFTTTRKLTTQQPTLEQMQARCIARTSTDTGTLKIELAGSLIIVHDFVGEQVYYIDR